MKIMDSPLEVWLDPGVFNPALSHSAMSPKYEVMGVLIGSVKPNNDRPTVAHIRACLSLVRPERWESRVEIEPDRLVEGTLYANAISEELGEEVNVLGWYHSHPSITSRPSKVDLKTQLSFQSLDKHFVGLIFAFYVTGRKASDFEVRAFQSRMEQNTVAEVQLKVKIVPGIILNGPSTHAGNCPPVGLSEHCKRSLMRIPLSLKAEEEGMKWNREQLAGNGEAAVENGVDLEDDEDAEMPAVHGAGLDVQTACINDTFFCAALSEIMTTTAKSLMMELMNRETALKHY